jgi:hypothetical protein
MLTRQPFRLAEAACLLHKIPRASRRANMCVVSTVFPLVPADDATAALPRGSSNANGLLCAIQRTVHRLPCPRLPIRARDLAPPDASAVVPKLEGSSSCARPELRWHSRTSTFLTKPPPPTYPPIDSFHLPNHRAVRRLPRAPCDDRVLVLRSGYVPALGRYCVSFTV